MTTKEYRDNNKQKILEYNRKYNNKNKEWRVNYCKDYYINNKQYFKNKAKNKNYKLKCTVIEKYSNYKNICEICGENRIEVLTIDHINGGGTQHRKQVGYGSGFYRWLINMNFPDGFQVLCMNCNWFKRYSL